MIFLFFKYNVYCLCLLIINILIAHYYSLNELKFSLSKFKTSIVLIYTQGVYETRNF